MTVCGDADDCISTAEAADLADKLEQKEIDGLPRPGDVEFIIGGPPCQVSRTSSMLGDEKKRKFCISKSTSRQSMSLTLLLAFHSTHRTRRIVS